MRCFVPLLAALAACTWVEAVRASDPCSGGFDLFFVLDQSGSVGKAGWSSTLDFVKDTIPLFPEALVGIAGYNERGYLYLPLTADRSAVEAEVARLRREVSAGGKTNSAAALTLAQDNLSAYRFRAGLRFIIVVSDGKDNPEFEGRSRAVAKSIKEAGTTVFGVGVAQASMDDIAEIASTPRSDYVYHVNAYDELPGLIGKIAARACVAVTSVSPAEVCIGDKPEFVIEGIGFSSGPAGYAPLCRIGNAEPIAAEPDSSNPGSKIVCRSTREFNETASLPVSVSLNGVTFTRNDVVVKVNDCGADSIAGGGGGGGLSSGAAAAVSMFIILLLLLLLWCLWPIISALIAKRRGEGAYGAFDGGEDPQLLTSSAAGELPPPPPPPAALGGKKWADVDTSHYVWARDGGGARPLSVQWGEGGATESAPHKLGAELREPEDGWFGSSDDAGAGGAAGAGGPGCLVCFWRRLVYTIKKYYYKAAALRPQPRV